jgi:predicted PurR-regulated permease PerM
MTLAAFLGLMALLIWANYRLVGPYLLAVLMGGILAIVFWRPYSWLRDRLSHRKTAGVLLTASVTLLLVVPILLLVFLAITQAIDTAQQLTGASGFSLEAITHIITRWKPLETLIGNPKNIEIEILAMLTKIAALAPGVIFNFFGGLPAFVLQLILGILSCFFFLVDGEVFLTWLRDKLPLNSEVRFSLYTSFHDTAVSTILATLAAAGIQTLLMFFAFLALDIPAAFLAGGATFILAWIPLVGSTPVWGLGAIYLFANESPALGVTMLAIGFVTGISDNIARTWVLKGRGQMHPLVSLIAIFGGIRLFGIFGVFIGPILAALLISVLNIWPTMAERFGVLHGERSPNRIATTKKHRQRSSH